MERRRTVRLMPGKGLVALGRCSGETAGAGWPLKDISEGGIRFAVAAGHPDLPGAGERVVVTIDVNGDPAGVARAATGHARRAKLRLTGVVRRVNTGGPAAEREVGVEFSGLSAAERDAVRGAVLDLAMERASAGLREVARRRASSGRKPGGAEPGGRLGDVLVARNVLGREEIERFVSENYDDTLPLGRRLVSSGTVPEAAVAGALAEQAGLPYVDLNVEGIDLLLVRQVPEDLMLDNLFVPLGVAPRSVTVAAAAPLSDEALGAINAYYGRPVGVTIASERQIVSAIQKAYNVTRNRRRAVRQAAELGLRYKLFDEGWRPLHDRAFEGLTRNISDEGILFVGPGLPDKDLAAARRIGVHLVLPDEPPPVRMACRLARAGMVGAHDARNDGPDACLYAARALFISDGDRARLRKARLRAYYAAAPMTVFE